jgi:hypothetical protein
MFFSNVVIAIGILGYLRAYARKQRLQEEKRVPVSLVLREGEREKA